MDYILAAATAMEMRAVIGGLGADTPSPDIGGAGIVHVRDLRVRLVVTGIGPLAAAFHAGQLAGQGLLTPERCRGVLCLGIAGTYDLAAAPIGSVALADKEIWPEYGLVTGTGVDAKALGFPLSGAKGDTSPPPVWDSLSLDPAAAFDAMRLHAPHTAPLMPENPPVRIGPSITVAGCSGTHARARALASGYSALTENMEGFPLALAARQAGVPFAEVRAVSNIAGDRSKEAWDIPASLTALSRVISRIFSPTPPQYGV